MDHFITMIERLPGFSITNYKDDWRWQLLEKLYEENYIGTNAPRKVNRIPKKIHQIWLGGKFPDKYRMWSEMWKQLHPDYEYKLWTEADVDSLNLPNRRAYNNIVNPGPKSDILRFHILNKFGGIYIDTDFECIKNFDDLSYLNFYTGVGYPSKIEIYPGLMASVPHHPILEKATKEIDKVTIEDIRSKGVLGSTSSYFFTNVFFEVIKKYQNGIVVFPPDYFYPFPNHKGYKNEDSRKYVTKCSYAVHNWEVSWNTPAEGGIDWIQGDKFVKIADYVYAPFNKASDDYAKYPNTFDPVELKPINFVYTNTMYLARLLRILPNLPAEFVVMSHNGDQHTDEGSIGTYSNGVKISEEPYTLSDNILRMYVQNVNVIHPRIDTIPLGLENSMWGKTKKELMLRVLNKMERGKLQRTKLVYMNHNTNTRLAERKGLYDKFGRRSWVTSVVPGKTVGAIEDYFENIAKHKFIMNPWGNCFDNHRMWEALYLGCIPITKRCIFTSFYDDFPICIIDDWNEVTEEFLNKEYVRIQSLEFNRDKLSFAYWKNKVRAIQ